MADQRNITFKDLVLLGKPGGQFQLTVSVPSLSETVQSYTIQLHKQECSPGQGVQNLGNTTFTCVNCLSPYFCFSSNAPQQPCPEGTQVCNGSVVIAEEGNFHSHPRSAQMLVCPQANACIPPDVEKLRAIQLRLASAGDSAAPLTGQEIIEYQQLQCTQGNAGLLCSRCLRPSETQNGTRWGMVLSNCAVCNLSQQSSLILYAMLRLVDLIVIGAQLFAITRYRNRRLAKLALSALASSGSILDVHAPGDGASWAALAGSHQGLPGQLVDKGSVTTQNNEDAQPMAVIPASGKESRSIVSYPSISPLEGESAPSGVALGIPAIVHTSTPSPFVEMRERLPGSDVQMGDQREERQCRREREESEIIIGPKTHPLSGPFVEFEGAFDTIHP
jgi:hypothetical protein